MSRPYKTKIHELKNKSFFADQNQSMDSQLYLFQKDGQKNVCLQTERKKI